METITRNGKQFVLVPADAWNQLSTGAVELPPLPAADADGNRDALEFARATIARGIVRDRTIAGISQAELARLAGIQPASLNRIERGKVMPDKSTLNKIDRALSPFPNWPPKTSEPAKSRTSVKKNVKTSKGKQIPAAVHRRRALRTAR